MNSKEIIEMARQAGMYGLIEGGLIEEFEAFAKLVAAKEREACAKVCDNTHFTVDSGKHFSERIRARGEA